MTSKPKGRPFTEILFASLQEDYRFPILEIFVFLYAISTFAFTALFFTNLPAGAESSPTYAVNLVSIASGTPLFIFIILVFKNLAFGLGGDLERGSLQTFLSYPIKRRGILTARLLSAIGLSLAIFLSLQFLGLSILVPTIFHSQPQVVELGYLSAICSPLLLAGIILMITILVRRGSIALVAGIVLYFALAILGGIVTFLAYATDSSLPLEILAIFNPSIAFSAHYDAIPRPGPFGGSLWSPSFQEVYLFILGGYLVTIGFFVLDYYLFDRRLGL